MKKILKVTSSIFLLWVLCIGIWHSMLKPLPKDINMVGKVHAVSDEEITFFADRTFLNEGGIRQSEQQIFDSIFEMIAGAEEYILIDMFLFNDFLGTATEVYRPLSTELVQALVVQKEKHPAMVIQFITDPINTVYGGDVSAQIDTLRNAGVSVIVTDVALLHDSNPVYSAFWRVLGQWWSNSTYGGWIVHAMDVRREDLTLRTYLRMLNFKANHRKVIVADFSHANGTKGMSTFITSANPHDGSSAHSNSALKVDTMLWQDVVASEQAVVVFSGDNFIMPKIAEDATQTTSHQETENTSYAQLLTEEAIREAIIQEIDALGSGDTLDMAMFYISDRKVVRALKRAEHRGIVMRFIFDPNKDAFGRQKGGVPNRQVAQELLKKTNKNVQIRWCNTHGEQCHSKMIIMHRAIGETVLLLGSANLTRRNIGNHNLETNILVKSDNNPQYLRDAQAFFDEQWENQDGRSYTVDYETYKDESLLKVFLYRFMETTGMSSF